jgi:hypothetical protein
VRKLKHLLDGFRVRTSATLSAGEKRRTVTFGEDGSDSIAGIKAGECRKARRRGTTADLWWRCPEDLRFELTAGITPVEDWTLSSVTFEIRVPARGKDSITWPFSAGAVIPVREFSLGRTLELTYPVYASMQWVDVFSATRGFYTAAHDEEPWFKHMRVRAEEKKEQRFVVLEFIYTDLEWPSGREWVSPPLVLAAHEGDWTEGARIYRTWADTWLQREPMPEWLRRTPGHNMISFPHGGGRVPFRKLPELAKASRSLGLDGIHVADWMRERFDTFYPDFRADPELGGKKALRKAVADLERKSIWTCLYTNGRILDVAGPYGKHAFDWAVKLTPEVRQRFHDMWDRTQDRSLDGWDPEPTMRDEPEPFNKDGSAAQEWWGRTFVACCPTDPGWKELWLSRLDDVARSFGPRMIQVDQVCGCWGLPCYDEKHPHLSPSLAWSGYKEFTRRMRERARSANPDVALWTEGTNDLLGQSFDGVQVSLGFDSLLAGLGEWDPRIFKYAFPEYLMVSGDLKGNGPYAIVWAMILGGHFHFFIPDPERLDAMTRKWIRYATRVRSRYWRELTSTEVRIPTIHGDDSVRALLYTTGRRLLLIGSPLDRKNGPDRDFECEIRLPEPVDRVRRTDWVDGDFPAEVRVRRHALVIKGRGPFAILMTKNPTPSPSGRGSG